MTTDQDILDVLRRDPDDPAALQVYADALLQRGDARGELALLQQRAPHELDLAGIERLMELVAEHGYLVLPDDPEADVLRFRGGSHHDGRRLTIEYRLVHAGRRYEVIEHPFELTLRITRDGVEVRKQRAVGMLQPDIANVMLAQISEVIRTHGRWDALTLPTHFGHPRNYVGRFPTEPLPPALLARWPHGAAWEIERRDLDRFRVLVRRWSALRARRPDYDR